MSGKGYSIVFSSRTGNTAELAETVREALPEGTCEYFGSVNDAVGGGSTAMVTAITANAA